MPRGDEGHQRLVLGLLHPGHGEVGAGAAHRHPARQRGAELPAPRIAPEHVDGHRPVGRAAGEPGDAVGAARQRAQVRHLGLQRDQRGDDAIDAGQSARRAEQQVRAGGRDPADEKSHEHAVEVDAAEREGRQGEDGDEHVTGGAQRADDVRGGDAEHGDDDGEAHEREQRRSAGQHRSDERVRRPDEQVVEDEHHPAGETPGDDDVTAEQPPPRDDAGGEQHPGGDRGDDHHRPPHVAQERPAVDEPGDRHGGRAPARARLDQDPEGDDPGDEQDEVGRPTGARFVRGGAEDRHSSPWAAAESTTAEREDTAAATGGGGSAWPSSTIRSRPANRSGNRPRRSAPSDTAVSPSSTRTPSSRGHVTADPPSAPGRSRPDDTASRSPNRPGGPAPHAGVL